MKGDFTRQTFNPEKHYSGVRMQQGRVQLDADWNEQVDITAHRDRVTTGDVVGASGVPVLPDGSSSGFKIVLPGISETTESFTIREGHIYVDGILCENDSSSGYDFSSQPHYTPPEAPEEGLNVVYLDVWERTVTAAEDASIREVALGGPDTAARTQTVWQVKLLPISPTNATGAICSTTFPEWDSLVAASTGALKARTATLAEGESTDPCIVPASAGYRGLENQLYRVEIHSVIEAVITYKWSRDNGTFLYPVQAIPEAESDTATVVLADLGKDENSTLNVNDWVELQSRTRELHGFPGSLAKVTAIDTVDRRITLQAAAGQTSLTAYDVDATEFVSVRRWDFTGSEPPTTSLSVGEDPDWIAIEDGVEVLFQTGPDGAYTSATYHTGDYWTIPARIATQDIEWPTISGAPVAVAPHGVRHHYTRLGLLNQTESGWERASLKDCRRTFLSLSDIPTLGFHFVAGDGQEASPGGVLPRLLQVSVTDRGRKAIGARVRFKVRIGNGRLHPIVDGEPDGDGDVEVIAETDVNGVASCQFTLDEINSSQQVEAVLLGELDLPLALNPIRFNAGFTSSGVIFSYVCGDGQDGLPSEYLPVPLTVGVNEFGTVSAGAKVQFRITKGSGLLRGEVRTDDVIEIVTGSTLIIETGEDGIARVEWRLDASTRNQQVEARLLDDDDAPRSITPICFNAGIGSNLEFNYVGGDGQEALPGGVVPMPLEVGVMDGEVKVQAGHVKFVITGGAGTIAPRTTGTQVAPNVVIAETNIDGIAAVDWTLDAVNPVQQVSAYLLDGDDELLEFTPVHFNATISRAAGVAYTPPSDCTKFSGTTTVQDALDKLCECDCGSNCPPVIRVTGVFLGTATSALGVPVNPYTSLTLDSLQHGLRIVTDTELDPAAAKPCSVFGDASIPYPLDSGERTYWGLSTVSPSEPFEDQFIGTRPINMMAEVEVDLANKHVIRWKPTSTMLDKLQLMLETVNHDDATVPVKLAVKGSSIWAEGNTGKLLAGNASFAGNFLTVPTDRDCDEPSDFIFCFVLVKNPEDPCVKISAVHFDGPIIGGSNTTGHVYFEQPVLPASVPTLKVTSKVTSVVDDHTLVLTPYPSGSAATNEYRFTLSPTEVDTATTVQLTVENNSGSDPCKRSITTVVTVNPKPCAEITGISFPNPVVIGQDLQGVLTFASGNQADRSVTITSSNTTLIPNPLPFDIEVDDLTHSISIATSTNPTVVEGVTERTPVTLTVSDPCNGTKTVTVYVDPEPCDKIDRIEYVPVVGGSMASYTVTFAAPLTKTRVITFTSSNTDVVKNKTYTFVPSVDQVEYVVPSVETLPVTIDTEVVISTDPCGGIVTRRITVLKRPCIEIAEFNLPTEIIGGESITASLKLRDNVSYAQHVQIVVDSANTSIVEPGAGVDFSVGQGLTAKNFTLVTHTLSEARDIAVRAILCGEEIVRWIKVLPIPCEYPVDYVSLPEPLHSGVSYTPGIYLNAPSYSDTPINITFNPSIHAPIVVSVDPDQQLVSFPLTFAEVAEDTDVEIVADRCGRILRIRRRVLRPVTGVPRITKVTMVNPDNPSYSVDFVQPNEPAQVDVPQLELSGSGARLQIRVEFDDTVPTEASVNNNTFMVVYHDENPGTPGRVLTGVDVLMEGDVAICEIPAGALNGGYYRVVLKGTGSGEVIKSAANKPLDGVFRQPLDGANTTGSSADTTGSNFVGVAKLAFNPGTPGAPGL